MPEFQLDPSQQSAVDLMTSARMGIVTGGPGTGKTTTLRTALDLLDRRRERYALAAPTGKAARRMSEATGRPAETVHRMLEFNPTEGWFYNRGNPIPVDAVFVDESSMLDDELAGHLFDAIHAGRTRVILIGDADQLPPVGPGEVFAALIRSERVPVARLTTLHRAAAESWVCRAAARVIAGKMPSLEARHDFEFVEVGPPGEVVDAIRELVGPGGRYHGPDAQVLSPQRTGGAGVTAINTTLQAVLNPGNDGRRIFVGSSKDNDRQIARVGDRVMQIRNNRSLDVMNGELGRVVEIGDESFLVDIDGSAELVKYPKGSAEQLRLAYALTIHKTQGSEFPRPIVVCHSSHARMLTRQLLYTAITRAKEGVVIVGDKAGVSYATNLDRPVRRLTSLDAFLCARLDGLPGAAA